MVENCAPDLDCLESVSDGDGAARCYASGNETAKCCGHVEIIFQSLAGIGWKFVGHLTLPA